jgi:hypothetical protein
MIIRNKPSTNFTILRNAVLNDEKLSLKAKGLWAFLMSKPDGWTTSVHGLMAQVKDGEASIRTALKELEAAHLYRKTRVNDKKGLLVWQDFVYDKPFVGNPVMDNPVVENRTQVNTNKVKTEIVSNSTNVELATPNELEVFGKPEINELFEYWLEKTGIPIAGNVQRNRYACKNLLKKYELVGVKKLIEGVALAQTDKYAPRICDFAQLQSKLSDLLVWGKKKSIGDKKGVIKV